MFIVNVPFNCDDPADDGKDGGSFEGKFAIDADGTFDDTKTDDFGPPSLLAGGPTASGNA